jgi:hypothetical protein
MVMAERGPESAKGRACFVHGQRMTARAANMTGPQELQSLNFTG